MQKKRKIIMDFIAARITESGAKKESHINIHALENVVIWNYGTTREKANELITNVLEIMEIGE